MKAFVIATNLSHASNAHAASFNNNHTVDKNDLHNRIYNWHNMDRIIERLILNVSVSNEDGVRTLTRL